jgi:hypothetical protein
LRVLPPTTNAAMAMSIRKPLFARFLDALVIRKGARPRGTSPVATWLKGCPRQLETCQLPQIIRSRVWGSDRYPAKVHCASTCLPVTTNLAVMLRQFSTRQFLEVIWGGCRITKPQKHHVRPSIIAECGVISVS